MSSGQWEVVGKNKKDKVITNGKVKTNEKKKNLLDNGPKLEDIMPPSQIKAIYAAMNAEDDKKQAKEGKKKDGDQKKQQPKKQISEKKSELPKPKPPKSIEAAFNSIDSQELQSLITSNMVRFSNAPLVWLKEVASFLNSKTALEVPDAVFSTQSVNYPLNILPGELKKMLEDVMHEAGKANCQLFFENTLTALANDMTRGQSAIGHKLLLQMLAQEYPEFCVASVQKSTSLRNSYQNRPPIGLSLLWAFGQGGYKNLSIGLQAWQELFLPVIELRHYTKYVIGYLSKVLDKHSKMDGARVSQEQFLALYDSVAAKSPALNKEASAELVKQLTKIRNIYISKNPGKLQVAFNQLLKKLPNQYVPSSKLDPYQREIVNALVECLERDETCNATWKQLYQRCTKHTVTLLDHINTNWSEISSRLSKKPLKSTLGYFQEQSAEGLKGKKKDDIVISANKLSQDILDKMARKSRKGFPWFKASFLVLLSIAGLVAYDVSKAGGNFPKSATGKLFKDIGILEQTQYAWDKTMSNSARGFLWLESNTPIYYKKTIEVSKPYLEFTKDVALVAKNKMVLLYGNIREYVVEKYPVVRNTVDDYAPGLWNGVGNFFTTNWAVIRTYSGSYYNSTITYFNEKVFIGEWAPEVLQDKTLKALNNTKGYVSQYYDWFHQKVDTYSKIK